MKFLGPIGVRPTLQATRSCHFFFEDSSDTPTVGDRQTFRSSDHSGLTLMQLPAAALAKSGTGFYVLAIILTYVTYCTFVLP